MTRQRHLRWDVTDRSHRYQRFWNISRGVLACKYDTLACRLSTRFVRTPIPPSCRIKSKPSVCAPPTLYTHKNKASIEPVAHTQINRCRQQININSSFQFVCV
ncbi:unnamed protein product [Pylaiella littoralis]